MLGFIRSDLAELAVYTPHPGGTASIPLDRLDTNESPYDLPKALKEKLNRLYVNQMESNRYPDGAHHQLKEAIADYVNESGSDIKPENISIGNGSDELIRSLLMASCLKGEGSILVAEPTFSMYGIIAQTLGIPVHTVGRDETDFAINLTQAQQIIEQTHNPPIRVVFVVHPNSPTANSLNSRELEWLSSLSENILVVIDEAYFEFSQTSLVTELAKHPNWLILRTFSKAFRLAFHRVGYAIAQEEIIKALEKVRLPYNIPGLSQASALVALTHRQELLPIITVIIEERERLFQALKENQQLRLWASAANFIYARTKTLEAKELTAALKAQGTLIRNTGGGLRITVGTPEENTRTITRIEQITTPS